MSDSAEEEEGCSNWIAFTIILLEAAATSADRFHLASIAEGGSL